MTRPPSSTAAPSGTVAVGVGGLVSSIAAYGFQILGARVLGDEAYAPVGILWTLQYLVLTVGLLSMEAHVTRRGGAGPELWRWLAVLGGAVGGAVAVAGPALFEDPSWTWPLAATAIVGGYGLFVVARGQAAARGDFRGYALLTGGESVGRLVLAAAVLAIGARTVGLAWTLPTGAAVMATWWLVRNRVDRRPAQQAGEGTLPFVAATTVANGIAQVLLAAGPLAVAALGATAATTTVVFVTTTAARAPLVFVHSGALARILPAMQQMVADGRRSELRGQVVRWIAPGMAVLALAAVAGAAAGPPLVGLAFGAALRPGILLATLTAVSVVLAMGALLLNQVAIALDDSSHLLPPWLLGLAAGAAGLVIAGPDPVARVAVASTAGLGVATVAVLVQVLRRLGRPDAAR